jgi:hypothetical protein
MCTPWVVRIRAGWVWSTYLVIGCIRAYLDPIQSADWEGWA